MARTTATPESRKHRYGTPGRTLADWEVLKETWERSAKARAACNNSFTKFEIHAYAQPKTQESADGISRTRAIWTEAERLGFAVTKSRPVHFSRRVPQQESQSKS